MDNNQIIERSVFDQESPDRVKSPERLDKYIRVSTPSAWMIIAALALVLTAILIWGVTGSLPVNFSTTGVGTRIDFDLDTADFANADDFRVEGLFCAINPASISSHEIQDKEVVVTFRDGKRVKGNGFLIDTNPENKSQVIETLKYYKLDSEWIAKSLNMETDFVYLYYVEFPETLDYLYWGESAEANVIIDEVRPIDFMFGGGA